VESAASSAFLPGVPNEYQLELNTAEGRAESEPKMRGFARFVTPTYFATLGIPLLAGELCRDDPGRSLIMVNRSFANCTSTESSAIGHTLTCPGKWLRAARSY
jgi:hypothetical protein